MADMRIASKKGNGKGVATGGEDYRAADAKTLAVYDTLKLLEELMNPHQDGLELSIGARIGLCRILRGCAEDLKAPMDALGHAADMSEGEEVARHDQ